MTWPHDVGRVLWARRHGSVLVLAACISAGATTRLAGQRELPGPVIAVQTGRGTFWIETFARDAPASVEHIVSLVTGRFYDGQRVHRALPGFLVQFGDPQTRDLSARSLWGRGAAAASGRPVGVAEISDRRIHRRGTVGLAHMGNPAAADSQLYVTLADRSELNGRYAIVGQVISGLEVLDALQVGDDIIRVYVD
jgi:cyclophilin family peptidyl-prolyl cis-trans isomerase